MDKIRILYVDDEAANLNSFRAYFRRNKDYEIHTCLTATEGLRVLKTIPFAVVVSDQKMPGMTGVEFIRKIPMNIEPVKIVVTAHRDTSAIEKALKERKIFGYLDKPWKMEDLERMITEACTEYLRRVTYSSGH